MNGDFNFGCAQGKYGGNGSACYGAAAETVALMPPSVQQVFQINGGDVMTGCRFGANSCGGEHNPVKYMYQTSFAHGCRSSWDPITVYLAVMGNTSLYSSAVEGRDTVSQAGEESFDRSARGFNQFWIDMDVQGRRDQIQATLEQTMCAQPLWRNPYSAALGSNCYGPREGQPAHGARDLEQPAWASCGQMSVPECQRRCDATPGCDAVTVRQASVTGLYDCYRKADLDLSACDAGTEFDTFYKAN